MATAALPVKNLFSSLDSVFQELSGLIAAFGDNEINMVPFKDSWTAAQVAAHVTKSITGVVQAMEAPGKPADRKPDARIEELKVTFLDFTTKLQSPDFILPTQQLYDKEILITDLKSRVEQLKELSHTANLSSISSLPALDGITKFELLHFVVYHTQRHIHQLKNIFQTVHKR